MMKKGFFDKVFSPGGTIDSKDLMGEARSRFLAIIEDEYGYNKSSLANRLFYIGFDEWMLRGIDAIKDAFAREHPALSGWRSDKSHSFWELVESQVEQKNDFYKFLYPLGIKSQNVVRRRFHDEDWKPWERVGMEKILTDYCDRY